MKKIVYIILLGTLLFLPFITLGIAETETETYIVYPQADSFVDESRPDRNFGDTTYLLVGEFASFKEYSYIYFEYSNLTRGITEAVFSIYFFDVQFSLEVGLYDVQGTWDEMEITWDNKPTSSQKIGSILVTEDKIFKVNIFDYAKGKSSLSICLQPEDFPEYTDIMAYSYEGLEDYLPFLGENLAQIEFTYDPELAQQISIPGYNTVLIFASTIGIIAIISKKIKF